MDLNQKATRTPVRKVSHKAHKHPAKPTEINRVVQVYLKKANHQFYQIDFADYDHLMSKEMKSKHKSRAQHLKSIISGTTPKAKKPRLKEIPFQEPICPAKLTLKAKIEEHNLDIQSLQQKKIKALKKSGVIVASDLNDSHASKASLVRRTPKNDSLHTLSTHKPLMSLPPIQKTDYNSLWKKHQITRNVQEAWGHRKSTSPVSIGSKKYSRPEEYQDTLDLPVYENPSTFRNLKSKKSKGERSPNSMQTGPDIRSHTGMDIYSPFPASTKGSYGGNYPLLGSKQLKKQVSLSSKQLRDDNERASHPILDSSSKHEFKTLESSHSEYRRILPSTSYQKSFKISKHSALGSTTHSKKNSLIMSSNNFNVYKPKLPKLLSSDQPSRNPSKCKLKHSQNEDSLAVPLYRNSKKSPRYQGIPVPKGEPYYVTMKSGEDRQYEIKVFLFKNFQFLVIDCVYGEYIWDRDKVQFGELEDLTGQGLDFENQERSKALLEQFVNNCLTILNGKIVVRAPDLPPAQIQLNEEELEGAARVDQILKEMKMKNDQSYKRFLRSVTIVQQKFKSRSIHEIGNVSLKSDLQLKKQKAKKFPVLIKGAIKLGPSFYRYTISAEQGDADLGSEMELDFYDLTNRRDDSRRKRVKIFDVLELIDKLKEGESYSMNKIASQFLAKLQKFSEYLQFRSLGELIESAFEINSKEQK